MKKFLATLLFVCSLFFMSAAQAENETYTGEGKATMSEAETQEKAIERAKTYALREAREKAGVYIKSQSRLRDLELVEDEVITLTGGILKVKETKTAKTLVNDVIQVTVTVTVTIDSEDLQREIDKFLAQNPNRKPAPPVEIGRQKKSAPSAGEIELAKQKFAEGEKLANEKKYAEGIPFMDEAIELNPNYAETYMSRGFYYWRLKQYERAIPDCDKYIQLDSSEATMYALRGDAYAKLKQYEQAVQDFNKAIEFQPNYGAYYGHRGEIYYYLKDYKKALADFNKAIKLKPDLAWLYHDRAYCYQALGDNAKAQADFAKAKQLGWKD